MLQKYILKNRGFKVVLQQEVSPIVFSRWGHTLRGKPPGVARSLKQRLEEENISDPELTKKINIGFPKLKAPRSITLKERLDHIKRLRNDPHLEKEARTNKLLINLDEVKKEYRENNGPYDLKAVAEYFGIFQDLFGDAYFIPRVPLSIAYRVESGLLNPVHHGNIIMPSEAALPPEIKFDGETDIITGKPSIKESLWTIIMTNPDGHFSGEVKEYVHWMLTNIPGSNVNKAEEVVPYLQPFPPKGVGYQRFIFLLYKQDEKLDLSKYQVRKIYDLESRTFNTLQFYKDHQYVITPAGLSFFQSIWDKNLTAFYHQKLEIKEPTFEYDFPSPYIADEKWYPLKQPFNLYMDKHRDQKQVMQEYLERKLSKTHPFKGPEPPLRFPNAHPLKDIPSWLKTEIKKDRLRMGRINDI